MLYEVDVIIFIIYSSTHWWFSICFRDPSSRCGFLNKSMMNKANRALIRSARELCAEFCTCKFVNRSGCSYYIRSCLGDLMVSHSTCMYSSISIYCMLYVACSTWASMGLLKHTCKSPCIIKLIPSNGADVYCCCIPDDICDSCTLLALSNTFKEPEQWWSK